jgi:hypothetical protein
MNLFWKRIAGLLRPTTVMEKLENDFLTNAARYEAVRNSPVIASFRQLFLEVKLSSPSTRKARQKQLKELQKHPDVALYLNNIGGKLYSQRDVHLSFNDDFYWDSLTASPWKAGFYFRDEKLRRQYSYYNEQQANNNGKNTLARNGALEIHTRREALKTTAWHAQRGFMEKNYFFTSDLIQNGSFFRQSGGIFKAKIRCNGKAHHAFWLGTEKKHPHINIFHFNGKDIQMGYVNGYSGNSVTVTGINPSEYYIYSLEWTTSELIWSVNNVVVLRCVTDVPREALFMFFNSFIPNHEEGGEALLEVDWVRAYQFNT